MSMATLTSKGQTTIPKDIRDLLKINTGDRLEFIVRQDGSVLLKPATTDVEALKGLLKHHGVGKTVSIEQMNQAVKNRFGKKQ